jgi:NAD(P) transhydrogenase
VIGRETEVIRNQLTRNHIVLLQATARFLDANTNAVRSGENDTDSVVTADKIVVAVGTRPARPPSINFDERRVVDSDRILKIAAVPRSMVVVGAGVIGIEYASMFAALGTKVTIAESRERCSTSAIPRSWRR